MQNPTVIEEHFRQLEDVLKSPVAACEPRNRAQTLIKARQILDTSAQCCIVVATSISSNPVHNIIDLYRSMSCLKYIQRQLCEEYVPLHTCLIGIYPSLEYPACVYELNTNADRYVINNVFPYASSPLITLLKYVISKFIGSNPSVGGLGLAFYKG